MAERFIIDINVNGNSGQRTTTSGPPTQGRTDSAALAAGAGLLSASRDKKLANIEKTLNIKNDKWSDPTGVSEFAFVNPDTIQLKKQNFFTSVYEGQAQFFTPSETSGQMSMAGEGMTFTRTTEATVLGGRAGEFFSNNKTKIIAGATATAWKTVSTGIQYKNYRSGNSYANEQRNRGLRFAQQGVAIGAGFVYGGPVGAATVAAGIIISEAVNVGLQAANYNFDRKMDKLYIHNMTEVLGDMSYGRSRLGK